MTTQATAATLAEIFTSVPARGVYLNGLLANNANIEFIDSEAGSHVTSHGIDAHWELWKVNGQYYVREWFCGCIDEASYQVVQATGDIQALFHEWTSLAAGNLS